MNIAKIHHEANCLIAQIYGTTGMPENGRVAVTVDGVRYIVCFCRKEIDGWVITQTNEEDNKICKHNWANKGSYKQCSLCSEIIPLPSFSRINGIIPDLDTDSFHFYQLEDEVEQSDVLHQNDKHD